MFVGINNKSAHHLKDKVPPPEVSYGSRKPGPAPDESEEQTPLCEAELLHHLPEPSDQWGRALDALQPSID